jgi:hypothetical protein
MRGTILLLPKYIFMAWYLIKLRDNLTLLLHFHVVLSLEGGDEIESPLDTAMSVCVTLLQNIETV